MGTYDQTMVDDRQLGEVDDENNQVSDRSNNPQEDMQNQEDDGNGLVGRRVYLESPSYDNKEEEDMYRYVSSRLTNHTGSLVDTTVAAPTGAPLIESLDYEVDILGVDNTRSQIPNRRQSNPVKSQGQLSTTSTNMSRADPRQDPLLGPLLAELDAMTNQQHQQPFQQQQQLPPSSPLLSYRRNSVPYPSSFIRPTGSSQPNHVLSTIANRAVADALFESELYDTLDSKDQQPNQTNPYSTSNINLLNHSQPQQQQYIPSSNFTNMNNIDLFMPTSYNADQPSSFLSYFGPEDQLFQRPALNSLGQHYIPSTKSSLPPSQQQQRHEPSFDQKTTHVPSPQRTSYAPPQLPPNYINSQPPPPPPPPSYQPIQSQQQNPNIFNNEYKKSSPHQHYDDPNSRQIYPSNNHEPFFTDARDEPIEQQLSPMATQRSHDQQDQESRRQAVWNELQRTSAKNQEKSPKRREPLNRGKGAFGSSSTWNSYASQPPIPQYKPPQRLLPHPSPTKKLDNTVDHTDMNRNKENSYRSPVKRYEKLYFPNDNDNQNEKPEYEPKIFSSTSSPTTKPQRQTSLPVTINLNTNDNSQNSAVSGIVSIPLDARVDRDGDRISLNIDLRLADIQNVKQQQQQQQHQHMPDHPPWSTFDPLERHIRKMERNIDQSLPTTNPPQRSPIIPNTGVNPSIGRYGKTTLGTNRSGYNPPSYGEDYNTSDRSRDDDSYAAKLNQAKKYSQFKPYTGRDYEQFKKNYGFGFGHLGSDFDATNHREKTEKLTKTKQYAQQIEARNKKKLTDTSRRTYSDTRLQTETFKPSRMTAFPYTSIRPKQYSGMSIQSSPPTMDEPLPYIPARRPTEALYRPLRAPRHLMISPQHADSETIISLSTRQGDEVSRKPSATSLQNKREYSVKSDNRRINSVGKLEVLRANQSNTLVPKHLPTALLNQNNIKRRPIRFDTSSSPEGLKDSSSQQLNPNSSTN